MAKHFHISDSYFKDDRGVRVHGAMVLRDGYIVGTGESYASKVEAMSKAIAEARAWIVDQRAQPKCLLRFVSK